MRQTDEHAPRRNAADDERAREARSILERVRQETDPQVGAGTHRMLSGTLDHFAATDADPSDRMEVLGTRIGRLLALAAFIALSVSLLAYLTRS